MILYEKSYLRIEYNEGLQCLIHHWKGFVNSEQFREAMNQSVTCFEQRKINTLINNTKDLGVVKKEDTDWVATHAIPMMVQNGLKYMAFIAPSNVFTQVSVSNFKSKADDLLQIRSFDHLQESIDWCLILSESNLHY